MQTDENELDRYLKGKVEEAHFEFKEEYWQKALEMLDKKDEKKKRPGIWRWFTLLGVLLVVTAGAIFVSTNKTQPKNQNTKTSLVSDKNEVPQAVVEHSYNQDRPMEEGTTAGSNNMQNTAELKVEEQVTNSPSNNATPIEPPAVKSTNPTPEISLDQKTDLNKNKPKKANATPSIAVPLGTDVTQSNEEQKINKEGKKVTRRAKGNKKEEKAQSEKTIASPIVDNTVVLNGQRMQPIDTQKFLQKQPRDERIYNPRYNASLLNYETERIDSITILTFKPATETQVEISPKATLTDSSKRTKTLRLFLAAGANVNKGFKGNQATTVSWGVAPYFNAGFVKSIRSKISMSAHIGFTYFNGLNLEKTAVQYKYSFGFDSTKISVNYRRMYQLLIPISMVYHIGKLHTLYGGVGATYVFNTESQVTENKTSSNQKGYLDGINRIDIFSQLGYEFQFHKNFAAQTFWQQGFMNAAQKDFFNTTSSNTQTRISLGLKYYFKRNGN